MGFYIRKSLRFGPIRFNLSGSGVGVSAGVKGLRVGTGPRGNYVHVGRGGLYYRTTLPSGDRKPGAGTADHTPDRPAVPPAERGAVVMEAIDSGDPAKIVDSSSQALVTEIREKRARLRLAPVAGLALVLAVVFVAAVDAPATLVGAIAVAGIVGLIALNRLDKNRKTTVVFYDLESDAERSLKNLFEAFEALSSVGRLWHIPTKGCVHDAKYHAGAGELIRRTQIHVGFDNPKNVVTNIPTPNLPVGTQTIYLFPDRMLILDGNSVGGVSYSGLSFDMSVVRFIEDESVPRDSKIVGQTWRYVNKKGGPDRRFKDNRQLPIVEYGAVHISSAAGINEVVYASRVGAFRAIVSAVSQLAKTSCEMGNVDDAAQPSS